MASISQRGKSHKTIQHNDKFTLLNDKKRLPGNCAQPSTASCTRLTYSSQEFCSRSATWHRLLQQVETWAYLRHWEVPTSVPQGKRDSSTPPRHSPSWVMWDLYWRRKATEQKETVNQQTIPDPKIQVQKQKQHKKKKDLMLSKVTNPIIMTSYWLCSGQFCFPLLQVFHL